MKVKYFSYKYLISIIILFTCLFIFSTPSLALIPGDFVGYMGDPDPDGKVDFNDLMVFATAYGSETGDPNWNELCDLCGYLGDPDPDEKVNFDDLMVFATNYGKSECILPSAPILSDPGTTLPSPATYTVSWSAVTGATSYVLQEATSSDFTSGLQEYPLTDTSKSFSHTVTTSTTYYYRVAAIDSCGQGDWSNVEDITVVKVGLTTWTVMVYMDGDNNLEWCYWQNLDMMESVGSTEEVSIVIQMDLLDDCTGTYRYYVTGVEAGSEYPLYPDDIVQRLLEQNMSDPATLTDFINWAGDNYPADHYMLILCDHGAGWREEDEIFKGIIWDDTTGGNEHIDIPELAQSLETANVNVDILGLDACNMQMIEVAWELGMEMSSPPNYLIASENSGWTPAWPYDDFLAELTGNPNIEQSAICETIVNGYINSFSTLPATMSTFHFNNEFLSNGLDIINNFANALIASTYQEEISSARSNAQAYVLWDWPQYKDLYDFAQIIKNNVPDCQSEAQAVMDLVNSVIVVEGHVVPGMDNSHGLSIYLIDSPAEYDSSYDLLGFASDTQWDEFLQSGEGVVTGVEVIATTRQLQTTGVKPEAVSIFEEEGNTSKDYQIININNGLKGETVNSILVLWDAYYEVDGYRVYRKVNSEEFRMIFDWQDPPAASGYGVYDSGILEGNTYSYYITAYGTDWETSPSEIVTITITSETFLPPCSLTSPTNGSTIIETNPVFSWSPVGLDTSDLPYGQVYSGETLLIVYDANTFEPAWYVWFDDMTASSVTYDQNGNAYPLVPGHNYRWYIRTYSYDNNGNWVASSQSETWEFSYDGPVVYNVEARAITLQVTSMELFQEKIDQLVKEELIPDSFHLNELPPLTKGVVEYIISVYWEAYPEATGYKIYRSITGESYSIIYQDEPTMIYDRYHFWDEDVSEGTSYTYYVTAYGSGWETDPSLEVTIDTWLPPCFLISPTDQSVITDPTPTFTWNPVGLTSSDFPYGSIYSGGSDLWVFDWTAVRNVWRIRFANMTTSTSTYNQDGQATPLVSGHSYIWDYWGYGYDENGKNIAISENEQCAFIYIYK